MAYYTALITAWNGATQPPTGVTGTALTGLTTAQKLAAVNGWVVTTSSPKKAVFKPSDILNACVPADIAFLTTAQVTLLSLMLSGSEVDGSIGTTVRAAVQAIFSGKTTTLANLGALVAPFDNATITQSWCGVNGYPVLGPSGPGYLTQTDATAAGLS